MFHQITLLYYNISIYLYRSFSPVLVIALGLGIVPACPRMPVINALRSMSAKGCVKSAKFHCIATLRLKSRFCANGRID